MALQSILDDKVVLITGGTGSFGRQFIEIALESASPRRLIVFSRDELKQHQVRARIRDSRLNFFIGDVRDRDRLYRAFQADVDIVVHAAALKQVPSCEYNPFEAVKTNVLGAQNVIDAAIDCGVEKVMALSTDKAVNPVNIYGASKLCAEKLFVHGNSYAGGRKTRFSCVRYGNVFGSRGSVLPRFLKQRNDGSVSVTDDRMTRFWISLPKAVQFVINCLELMRGGEVFVPKIPSMRVYDMAKSVAPECRIELTGIRPGEKLHETLLAVEEARHAVELDGSYVLLPENPSWGDKEQLQGHPLPENFSYRSDNNGLWLTHEELNELVRASAGDWADGHLQAPSEEYPPDSI